MPSIEFLQNRLDSKEKELEKLNKKMGRILKAKESNYELNNPYYYSDYDFRVTTRDIEDCKKSIISYKEKITSEIEKDSSRDVAVILEFLENWKKRVTEFYLSRFEGYAEAEEQYRKDLKEIDNLDYWDLRKLRRENPSAYNEYQNRIDEFKKEYRNAYGFLEPYVERVFNSETNLYDKFVFDKEKLAKELDLEAKRKYDFIIERTNAVAGQITDASNLYIGAKGDLNGYIIGTKGTAKVQTIGAGGHCIQVFHYRTLINRMK